MIEKKVLIQSTTGSDLHGIQYMPSKDAKKTSILIMCHGFKGDKYEWGHFPELAKTCNKEGIDGLIFDFTGSGENERVPVTLFKQIEERVKALIREVAPGGGYCVGSGNSVTDWSKFENYMAMREATFKYGNYPIQL